MVPTAGRFTDPADDRPAGPPRAAAADRPKVQVAIPGTAEDMPNEISYDPETATLHVGAGRISPVPPEVWAYEVSGRGVRRTGRFPDERRSGRGADDGAGALSLEVGQRGSPVTH
jgi:hypothetical protein